MVCLDEAASSVATGRASAAGKTAVDGGRPKCSNSSGSDVATATTDSVTRRYDLLTLVTCLQSFICGTTNDAVSSSEHTVSNNKMATKLDLGRSIPAYAHTKQLVTMARVRAYI